MSGTNGKLMGLTSKKICIQAS